MDQMTGLKKKIDIIVISAGILAMVTVAGWISPLGDLEAFQGSENATSGEVSGASGGSETVGGEPRLDMVVDESLFKPAVDIFAVVPESEEAADSQSKEEPAEEPEEIVVEEVAEGPEETVKEATEEPEVAEAPPSESIDNNESEDFTIQIDLSGQEVTVFLGDDVIREMICSGGTEESPTPPGEFVTYEKIEQAWVDRFGVGAKYWTRFYNEYLIHSVPFDEDWNMIEEEYEKLGSPASHGCIRLKVEDAKWIYDNIPLGAKVVIY